MTILPEDLSFRDALSAMDQIPVIAALKMRYAEPWRHYHNELHITEIKDHLLSAEQDGITIKDGAAAYAFVLWHDAVYDPQATHGRNETMSAQLCSSEFGAIASITSRFNACDAILTTISHSCEGAGGNPDAPLLLDCDLAILAADPERFAAYNAAIRKEYFHVPETVYQTKRREVLTHFLERDRLYMTQWAYERWEERARENLRSVIG